MDLSAIRYCLRLKGKRIKVSRYDSEPDYGTEVLQHIREIQAGAAKEHRFDFHSRPEMNHVEAAILDLVARLFPDVYSRRSTNTASSIATTSIPTIGEVRPGSAVLRRVYRAPRTVQTGWAALLLSIVTDHSKEVYGREVFDLALAHKLTQENTPLVTNDFYLKDRERILVVSGANQGGKTTFARTFGQLHWRASIGFPVPGREAQALSLSTDSSPILRGRKTCGT